MLSQIELEETNQALRDQQMRQCYWAGQRMPTVLEKD